MFHIAFKKALIIRLCLNCLSLTNHLYFYIYINSSYKTGSYHYFEIITLYKTYLKVIYTCDML